MITRVLFVDSNAEALARIKQAVEQAGNYEVKVFVTGQAALEFARQNPPNIAIIALNLQDMPPSALVDSLRELHPGLPVLLRAPAETPEQILRSLHPQGVLEGGYTARVLLPMVENVLRPTPADDEPVTIEPVSGLDDDLAAFGEVLEAITPDSARPKDDTFNMLVESLRTPIETPSLPKRRKRLANWAAEQEESPSPEEDQLFQRLAAEEPPMPTLEDSGTVRDLIAITDFDQEEDTGGVLDIPDEMIEDISELALDEDEQALLEALAAVSPSPDDDPENTSPPAEPDDEALQPEPEANQQQLMNEPDPSPIPDPPQPASRQAEPVPDPAAAMALQLTQRTLASSAQASILVTGNEVLAAAGELPESDIAEIIAMIDCDSVLAGGSTKIKFVSLPEAHLNYMVVATPTVENMVLLTVFPENMHLRTIRRQTRDILDALLVYIEQPGLEPPAAASVVEDSTTGVMEAHAQETLAPAVPIDSDEAGHGQTGLIDSHDGEPVSSAGTDAEGVQRSTREQAESTPELDPATLTKYACAWILRDPDAELDSELINALFGWMDQIITEHRWLVEQVDVQADYLSLVVSIPPDETPSEVVQTLMIETAQRILAARPNLAPQAQEGDGDPVSLLWADAYYIIAPGRPITSDEISRFISYQRRA